MTQRLQKWLWFVVALYSGPALSPVRCVSVRPPPKTPSTIEAQAKFFQYRHLPTSEDFDQGHRLGSERHFTERHEKSRPSDGLFSAKVRWGDKKGGYGEHYWDLNHAGHAGNHGGDDYSGSHSDDGSYHDHDSPSSNSGSYDGPSSSSGSYDSPSSSNSGSYDGPSSSSSGNYEGPSDHSYGSNDYDPEKSSYEESGRAKRHHPRTKPERIQKQQHHDDEENEEEEETRPRNRKHKQQQKLQSEESKSDEDSYSEEKDDEEEQRVYKKPKRPQHRQQHKQEVEEEETTDPPPKEPKKKVVLVVQENDNQEKNVYHQPTANNQNLASRQADYTKYVPYEGGAGVRQHHHPEVQAVAATAAVPRLFLEPTTGHVVDRATGQAYVLQPIAALGYN